MTIMEGDEEDQEQDDWKLVQISKYMQERPHFDFTQAKWRFDRGGNLVRVTGAVPKATIH